ncbi:PQQ-binding-like beta-propeller repeat protein, partial [Candidatus Woesearchaeota archaeon]|nr:PQQ-binding-like beta-propeller repeat protein [Candidatus Woesearchaeota archaeon]
MAKHKGRVFEKWIFDAHSPLLGSAAVGDINKDGIPEVVFGTKKGMIHCLDHESKELWSFSTGKDIKSGDELFYDLEQLHAISSAPALADINNDGKLEVIVGTDDGMVYALSCTGEMLWEAKIGGAIKATPKVIDTNNDGNLDIIVTSTNKKLVVLNNEGKIIVSFKTSEGSEAAPGVLRGEKGKQSMIVFGLNDGIIHAINTQEKQLWTFKTGDRITAEPIFVKTNGEQLVIVGSWDGTLYALTDEGELKWK